MGSANDLVIPGQIGGGVFKASFVGRGQKRKTKAVASILVNRAIGILGLFTLTAFMGALNWGTVPTSVRRLIAVVWIAWFAGAMDLSIVLTPSLFRPLEQRISGRR